MSRQWEPRKQTVELQPEARPSRIRREPAPAVKQTVVPERDERDRSVVVIGVITFALALCVIAVGFSGYVGWSPSQYSVTLHAAE